MSKPKLCHYIMSELFPSVFFILLLYYYFYLFIYKKKLHKSKPLDHPFASVKITKYGSNKLIKVSALADTGAQSNLWGWKNFQDAGFGKKDLLPVSITIRAANKIC